MEDRHPVRVAARTLQTDRLVLRPYTDTDLEDMAAMFGDQEVTAHTLLGRRDRAQTAAVLDDYRRFLAERGYGMLAIRDRQTDAYLGECGLFVSPMGPLALRYALARHAWGLGYATEASRAVLDDAFNDLGLDRVLAGVMSANAASLAVMRKLGFSFDSVVTAAGHEFELFELTRQNWQLQSSAAGLPSAPSA